MSISSVVIRCLTVLLIAWTIIAVNPPNTAAAATCFCKVSASDLSGVCHPDDSQIILDLTSAVNTTYSWPRTETKWQACQKKCSDEALKVKDAVALLACSAGVPSGTTFNAYAALGNCGNKGEYASAQAFGPLINTPAVTQTSCGCPQGWTANAPKCSNTVNVAGLHYPNQSCAQSKANFEANMLTMPLLTSRCTAPNALVGISNVVCQDAPIPGFSTGSVYSATLCCGVPGVTTDGRCKKVACQPNHITPFPPNGTPIGTPVPPYGTTPTSWGFTWGDAFIAWGTTANGGAPTGCQTQMISPAVCKF